MGVLTARRRFGARSIDVRLLIGGALVLASVGGVWAVVSSSDRSVAVLTARTTIVAGDPVDADDLAVAHVSLAEADDLYVRSGALEEGAVATRTVLAGELVPQDAIGRPRDVALAPVVVTVAGPVPSGVEPGREADVWTAGDPDGDALEPPSVLVAGATVSRIVEEEGLVTGSADVSVEIAVPDGAVAVLLAAMAAGDTLALVPVVADVG